MSDPEVMYSVMNTSWIDRRREERREEGGEERGGGKGERGGEEERREEMVNYRWYWLLESS